MNEVVYSNQILISLLEGPKRAIDIMADVQPNSVEIVKRVNIFYQCSVCDTTYVKRPRESFCKKCYIKQKRGHPHNYKNNPKVERKEEIIEAPRVMIGQNSWLVNSKKTFDVLVKEKIIYVVSKKEIATDKIFSKRNQGTYYDINFDILLSLLVHNVYDLTYGDDGTFWHFVDEEIESKIKILNEMLSSNYTLRKDLFEYKKQQIFGANTPFSVKGFINYVFLRVMIQARIRIYDDKLKDFENKYPDYFRAHQAWYDNIWKKADEKTTKEVDCEHVKQTNFMIEKNSDDYNEIQTIRDHIHNELAFLENCIINSAIELLYKKKSGDILSDNRIIGRSVEEITEIQKRQEKIREDQQVIRTQLLNVKFKTSVAIADVIASIFLKYFIDRNSIMIHLGTYETNPLNIFYAYLDQGIPLQSLATGASGFYGSGHVLTPKNKWNGIPVDVEDTNYQNKSVTILGHIESREDVISKESISKNDIYRLIFRMIDM